MITDDARIVDAKACQLETWVKNNRNSTEYWALPACNFTGNLELTLGDALGKDDTGTRTTDVVFQGKTVFKPLEPNGWGWGLAFGNVRHPASFSFRDDRFVLQANLGWLHEEVGHQDHLTWSIGSETQFTERTWLIAEGFGQNQGKPSYQIGFRHWLVPERMQVDTTYGNRVGAARMSAGSPSAFACCRSHFCLDGEAVINRSLQ